MSGRLVQKLHTHTSHLLFLNAFSEIPEKQSNAAFSRCLSTVNLFGSFEGCVFVS